MSSKVTDNVSLTLQSISGVPWACGHQEVLEVPCKAGPYMQQLDLVGRKAAYIPIEHVQKRRP